MGSWAYIRWLRNAPHLSICKLKACLLNRGGTVLFLFLFLVPPTLHQGSRGFIGVQDHGPRFWALPVPQAFVTSVAIFGEDHLHLFSPQGGGIDVRQNMGVGQNIGTQNETLVNGNKD